MPVIFYFSNHWVSGYFPRLRREVAPVLCIDPRLRTNPARRILGWVALPLFPKRTRLACPFLRTQPAKSGGLLFDEHKHEQNIYGAVQHRVLNLQTCKWERRKAMFTPSNFEDFSNKINAIITSSPIADMEKNMRAMMSGFFSRMELVTREEFDIQTEILNRTREKLRALEVRLAALEEASRDNMDKA
jgi:BMFP domain-containing protein YqiC